MKKYWKKIPLIVLIFLAAALLLLSTEELLTFEALQRESSRMERYVSEHYLLSIALFAAAFFSTSFFLPGALILTVCGGFLFGALPGSLYAAVFSTAGSSLAFLASRHAIGRWVQARYKKQLVRFNEEILRYGSNYLFVLRVVPVLPSFVINYLSGLSHMSLRRFAVATFFGICPGAIVYSLAGGKLSALRSTDDLFSPDVLIGFMMMGALALLPVLLSRCLRRRRTGTW